jgi:hypothetical protein
MNRNANFVKEKLLSIISEMAKNKDCFVKNSGRDFTRNRKLSFEETLNIILSMGGGSITKELLEYFRYDTNTATSSAFIQQRAKINSKAFEFLFREFTDSMDRPKTHKGYRLVAVDGSDLHIHHNPNDEKSYFQSIPNSKGFNLIHLNVMFDLCQNTYLDACIQNGRKQNEYKALIDMVDNSRIQDEVLLIADRGYESYNVFAHIMEKGWKYLIRVKDINSRGILSSFKLSDEGELDRQVNCTLTRKQTKEIKARPDIYKFMPNNSKFDYMNSKDNPYYDMSFRIVRVKTGENTYQSFITNLDSDEFELEEIRRLYKMRWGVETSFRELKHTIGLTHLHTKKTEFVFQEVFAKMVMYNFCEIITGQVVIEQKSRKHNYQVNYSIAMQICIQFFKTKKNEHPPNVKALIERHILPIRKDRTHPRKIKFRTFVSFNYRVA